MASKTYKVVGRMTCAHCGQEIPARQSENGTLNLSCWLCGVTAHAKPGTEAHEKAVKGIRGKAPAADPAPAPAPGPTPAPAPKAFGIFNVGG